MLNELHNGKVIFLETDKVFTKGTKNMIYLKEEKVYLSKKVLNNKKFKITWRHLYSYLPPEIMEDINQIIYTYIMKTKVFKIAPKVSFYVNYPFNRVLLTDIYCEPVPAGTPGNSINYVLQQKNYEKIKEEKWTEVDYKVIDDVENQVRKFYEKNKIKDEKICGFIMKNGNKCKCKCNYFINLNNNKLSIDNKRNNYNRRAKHWRTQEEYPERINTVNFNDIFVNSLFNFKCEYVYEYDDYPRNITDGLNYKMSAGFCGKHFNDGCCVRENKDEFIKIYFKQNGYMIKNGYVIKC